MMMLIDQQTKTALRVASVVLQNAVLPPWLESNHDSSWAPSPITSVGQDATVEESNDLRIQDIPR